MASGDLIQLMHDLHDLHSIETGWSCDFQAAEPFELVQGTRDLMGDAKSSDERSYEHGRNRVTSGEVASASCSASMRRTGQCGDDRSEGA